MYSQSSAMISANSRTFPSPLKETLCPLAVTPFSLPTSLATTNLLPVSMDLPLLGIS